MMKISKPAVILALTAALISGTANFINKFAVAGFDNPVLFTTIKNSLVAIFILGIWLTLKNWSEIKTLRAKHWGQLALIGAVGGALPFALFFTGLAQTTAVNGALIHKTLFLFVACLAIPFLKERLVWPQWLGVALIFAANLVIGGFTGFKFNLGELLILGATILWAVENIIAKKALAEISSLTVAGSRMIGGAVLLTGYLALVGDLGGAAELSGANWGWILLTAGLLVGYVLTWYTALQRAPATYVAALLVPATLVTNILAAIFTTRAFSFGDLAMTILYAGGIILLIYYSQLTFKKCEPQLMHGS